MNSTNEGKITDSKVVDTAAKEVTKEEQNEQKINGEQMTQLSSHKSRKFPTWTDFFATVGVFVLSALIGSLLSVVLMRTRGLDSLSSDITFVYYLVQMLPTIAFVMWLRRRAGRDSGIHWGIRRISMPMILWGVVLMLASGVVLEPLLALFPTEAYDGVTDAIGFGGWAILSTVIAAPILEEILFRGLVFESCAERYGKGVALLISSLLFGIVHGIPVQIINAFVVGLILGYIYLKTRSLLSVIILHAVNNGIAYATLTLAGNEGNVTLRAIIPSDILYWLTYGLSALLFLWAMVRLWQTLHNDTEIE